MKKLSLLICLMISFHPAWCQEDVIQSTRKQLDSILLKVETEKDNDKRLDLILSIYYTKVEGYPLIILETFQKLLLIAQKNKDIISESSAYSLAGQGYRLTGNYVKGLEYHHKAIALAEQSRNISLLAWAQNQMAHIYKDREENEKAIRLYSKAKENTSMSKNEHLKIWPMMNLGFVYLANNQLDSSIFYSKLAYEKALKGEEIVRANFRDYLFSTMAGAYSKMGKLSWPKIISERP
jgi:tetratricopeptide (TPR) repeat protein